MAATEFEEGRILVVFRPGTLDFKAKDVIRATGGVVEHSYTPFEPEHYVVQVPREYENSFVDRYRRLTQVEKAERIRKS